MPSTTPPARISPDSTPTLRVSAAAPAGPVFLPKEHGSWSLVLEPLTLGLLVAPSYGGVALATAALAGFFARRPFKATLAPGTPAHHPAAGKALAMLAGLVVAGLLEAAVIGGPGALWPVVIAAPLGGLFVYFDSQNESRAAAAELAGSAAFALLPATIATLAGWSAPAALALTAIALARSIPTILTVRTCLRLNKRQATSVFSPLLAGGLAAAGLGVLAAQHLVPWLAAGLAALLLLRTVLFVSPLRPVWPTKRIGKIEAILGGLCIVAIALAYHLS